MWKRHKRLFCLAIGLLVLFLGFVLDLMTGARPIAPSTVMGALLNGGQTTDELVVLTIRLPRALIAVCIGACLAAAGAVMQALTRNPLAAPDLIGIHAGAGLFVVLSMFWLQVPYVWVYSLFAFLGAAVAAGIVLLLGSDGSRGGITPFRLVVAGAAVSILLSSLTQGVLVLHEQSLDEMRFWLAGSVAGRELSQLGQALPFLAFGLILAILLAGRINRLQLGDDAATSVGVSVRGTKLAAFAAVVLLAGGSVAIAGPIGFIGLAVPHIVRSLAGTDYRWIVPLSALFGGGLLLLADMASKLVIHPGEVPIGVMTALLGAPFFIYLARKKVWSL
ncbi:iron ABC transporter permease [Xylanibacillus composti]|uniref:Siderophore ABC transporter permease n=1 Tax=Xylanibacillus composti TaxID=1572762 RepID=A0A8J4GZ09_9BACL|nr:iron ABC transporter permease [Xylanibacillus composti]MDT9723962.1 iron ABC transporter permease [Xylanibacillus composti]GIQ67843.1 siderophore ABC transporter permease [Xylanibacillus composti]